MRWIGVIIRGILAVLVAVFAIPLAWDLLVQVVQARRTMPPAPWAIGGGLLLGLLISCWRKPDWLLHTVIHECCHALACLLLRVRIRSFRATDGKGGEVEHDACDPLRGTIISIAPYTLPLLLGPALIARLFVVPGPAQTVLSAVVGFLFITHLVGLVRNVRTNFWGEEGDLAKTGRPLALVLIILTLLLILTATVVVLWTTGEVQPLPSR